jgi:bifunctional DNA primase/polymerase-like protein
MIADFKPPSSDKPIDWALAYARAGMAVFPVSAEKKPLTWHGVKDASISEAQICAWWTRWPYAEPAWAVPAEIVVVDLDCKSGDDGFKDFMAREGVHPNEVITPQASSPRGGRHLVYAANGAAFSNTTRLDGTAIDLKTAGGYIVLPGLENGRAWLKPLVTPLAPSPDFVRERRCLLRAEAADGEAFWAACRALGLPRELVLPPPSAADVDAQLRGIVRRVAAADEGERNSVTFWAACRVAELVSDGKVERGFATDVVVLAARQSGLPEREARRTVQNGFREVRHG